MAAVLPRALDTHGRTYRLRNVVFLPAHEGARRFIDLCNDPEVLPWVTEPPHSLLTLSAIPAGAVSFVTEQGGCIAVWRGGGMYEAHTVFAPSARGSRGLEIGHAFMAALFRQGASSVYTMVPSHNRTARVMAHAMSLRFIGDVGTWRTDDGVVRQRIYAADCLAWGGWSKLCR